MKVKMRVASVEELLTVKVVHFQPADPETAPCGGISLNLTDPSTFSNYKVDQVYDFDLVLKT